MNAKLIWISVFAFAVTCLLPFTAPLQAQVLIDPRGEGAEDSEVENSVESSSAESTSTESTAAASAESGGTTTGSASDEIPNSESTTNENVRRESSLTQRRSLPPPREPDAPAVSRRTPPNRLSAALPGESEREPNPQPLRGTSRPYLGITFDPRERDAAVVGAIVPDSPAEQTGLQPGDVVESINDRDVGSIEDAFAIVGRLRPGEMIDIEFSRRISARTQAMLESAPDDAVAGEQLDTLPERRTASYREPPRADTEEPIPVQPENRQDRIRILRRYGEDPVRPNPDVDGQRELDRRELDRRELEEWLRERSRPPERPLRRPLLRWRRG